MDSSPGVEGDGDDRGKKRSFDEVHAAESPRGTDHSVPEPGDRARRAKSFVPRSYQVKVFEVAIKRNTIALLETGAGKTMIALMLIKEIVQDIKLSAVRKLIVFLAPTVVLVNQQYDEVKLLTDFQVGEYYGAKGIDEWNPSHWEKEIDEHNVLVMTPQILLNALRNGFLTMGMIRLMIIDECHHASGNHPYARIMREFYHKAIDRPKIFGMTASPVVSKGMGSEWQISELESILDSQIYSPEDRTELEAYVPSAKEICRFYDTSQFSTSGLKEKLEALLLKHMDVDENSKTLRRRLLTDNAKIVHCLDDLGLICAYEAVKISLENARDVKAYGDLDREKSMLYRRYLEEVLQTIENSMPERDNFYPEMGVDYEAAVDSGLITPKIHELLRIFMAFGEESHALCLIFVERIITANVIERLVKKGTLLSHFTVSHLTGNSSSADGLTQKMQKEVLGSFHSGKVNLLFSTDVIEEGIHVPECSCVIRFDLPKTVKSYIQSRGRARQDESLHISLLERANIKQRDQLFDIIRTEHTMAETASKRDPLTNVVKAFIPVETETVVLSGVSITTDMSVSLIHQYCATLPYEKFYSPKPQFQYMHSAGSYKCTLTLPPNAAFQTMVGPSNRNSQVAMQQVCLEACKKLHQMGYLNNILFSSNEETSVKENKDDSFCTPNSIQKELDSGAGTTKRKELHGTARINSLSGTWDTKTDGATLQAYKIDFACSIVTEVYSKFILLVESELDDDVANTNVELFLLKKTVKTSISSCGLVYLDQDQIDSAKCFQSFFFNGLFGRLYVGSKSSGKPREFLLNSENESLWSLTYMYLLLPTDDSHSINWSAVSSCVKVVDFFKKVCPLGSACSRVEAVEGSSLSVTPLAETDKKLTNLHFANGLFDNRNLRQVVVAAIHTGKVYSIVEVVSDMSADSPFEATAEKISTDFTSYSDYFKKKYGVDLMYPGQPLLRLKQSHNPHNLLTDFNEEVRKNGTASQKPLNYVHMPPELLLNVDVPLHLMKTFYLLPSVMHRLESLMLASQLRREINSQSSNFHIPISLILEALTTLRCCERFSMERLELLGDSVLKYGVSCHLFLNYPRKNEGQLSSLRSVAVRNSSLHKCGVDRKLQGYIRDSAFEPRRWVAPGQRTLHPVPCKCGVDTLEVPSDGKHFTEDPKVIVGKCCDRGHRYMNSKTIADCVEALIGAYVVGSGLDSALYLMKWLGIDVNLDPELVIQAINVTSLYVCVPALTNIEALEMKVGYKFTAKGLLMEATTHSSCHEQGLSYSYERLEFLGDSALDILITRYLYQNHTDVDPGELTDLRSASVNNENFAQVALRHRFQPHLQHCSSVLYGQITEYVKSLHRPESERIKGPKALGDLVESIVGAILIDMKLNLDEVWKIVEPLLSPIVTPDKLELPPWRELNELCDQLGYFVKDKCIIRGEMIHAEVTVQLKDDLLVSHGQEQSRKVAKGKAASLLLKELEKRGIYSKRNINGFEDITGSNPGSITGDDASDPSAIRQSRFSGSCNAEKSDLGIPSPEHVTINMKKGGPRMSLFELCKKLQWPMPEFETSEEKSKTPIEFEGCEKRTWFNSFTSRVTLHIPKCGDLKCSGDPRPDKKGSYDSAAVALLLELERQGGIIINKNS
ncbi:hypothetical protein MLD38_006189 [Melastoma candidum]|uniref:Uncharacterized protein n=1 Tax=Melastoma candidum TaxID=119954 RepID=A0ACB9RNA6_9MYRT|nr:hypothetical protein MLD38_006189 [Melastoma candidum]